ncbi:MAG: hypothetical protein MK135_06930, partial [Polyangiaceae bacterium]|nr:hypothetical protein [Polyangiaceae bacterium]
IFFPMTRSHHFFHGSLWLASSLAKERQKLHFFLIFLLVSLLAPAGFAQEAPPPVETVESPASGEPGEDGGRGEVENEVSTGNSTASEPQSESFRPRKSAGPFAAGSARLGVGLGFAQASTSNGLFFEEESWLLLGTGLGYYLIDGLELGLDAGFWVIGSPFIATMSPGVKYVFHQVPVVKPYVGTFYKHYFVSDFADNEAVGARGGVLIMIGPSSYLGAGLVYEHIFGRTGAYWAEDDIFSPELTLAFGF